MSQVADELRASRAAHTRYRQAAGKIDSKGNISEAKKHAACHEALQEAHDRRAVADELDPTHTDPAWELDKAPHDQLMDFYTAQLARYAA